MSRLQDWFATLRTGSVTGVLAAFPLTGLGVQLALDQNFKPVLMQQRSEVTGFAIGPGGQIYTSVISGYSNADRLYDLLRLNEDGSVDKTFALKSNTRDLQPWLVRDDGRILVTGDHFGWVNPDGTIGLGFPTWITCVNGYRKITHIELLADGKILVGGLFCFVSDGTNEGFVGGLIRLNPDGTLDTTFHAPATDPAGTTVFAVLPDGKLLVGALFRPRTLLRLEAAGSIDPSFQSAVAGKITAILPDVDGKSWIAGSYWVGTNAVGPLVRLNSDGSLDTSMTPLIRNGVVDHLVREAQGSFIVGGVFSVTGGGALRQYARIFQNATLDTNYISGLSFRPFQIAALPSGKALVRYPITPVQGGLTRLNSNGRLDASFSPAFLQTGTILQLTQQQDGRLLAITYFPRGFGVPWVALTRLQPDGSVDTQFIPQLDMPQGDYENPTLVAEDHGGRLLVGLSFATNNHGTSTLLRLHDDGTRDQSFRPPLNVLAGDASTITQQPDGKIVVGTGGLFPSDGHFAQGTVLARFNGDGTVDRTFGSPFTNASSVLQVALLTNGQFLVAGALGLLADLRYFGLLRLNPDGTLDPTFNLKAQTSLGAPRIGPFFIQSDGRIVFAVAGAWTRCLSYIPPVLVRLNADGTLSEKLSPSGIEEMGAPIHLDSADRLLIWKPGNLARLQTNWTLDPTFGAGPFFLGGYIRAISQLVPLSDGSFVLGGNFVIGTTYAQQNLIRLYPTPQPVPPFLSNLRVTNQRNVSFSAFTAVGDIYQVQAAEDLNSCASNKRWTVVTNLVGNGDFVNVTDPTSTNVGRRFYRIGVP
jgi:uncharacterized delta-60 repeat protein